MILTQSQLLEIKRTTKEVTRVVTRELSFSETRSLCLHIPVSKCSWSLGGLRNLSSREAIVLCLQLPMMHRDWRFAIWMEVFNLPKKYQYEGDWNIVHSLLRNRDSLERMITILLENKFSNRKIFGLLNDKALNRLTKIGLFDPYRHKVKKPQRKRGYNDHGSRKELHKWLPWNAYAVPDQKKIDKENELLDIHPTFTNILWHRIKSQLSEKPKPKEDRNEE